MEIEQGEVSSRATLDGVKGEEKGGSYRKIVKRQDCSRKYCGFYFLFSPCPFFATDLFCLVPSCPGKEATDYQSCHRAPSLKP